MIKQCGVVGMILALLVLRPCAVGACSCAPPATVAEALAQADSVFAGRIINILPKAGGGQPDALQLEPPVEVVFDVTTSWKGPARRTIVLNTVLNTASCEGYNFAAGGEYLVFAYRKADGSLGTQLCSRTSELAQAQADLAALGPGITPSAEPAPAAAPGRATPLLIGIALLGGLVGGALLLRRQRI